MKYDENRKFEYNKEDYEKYVKPYYERNKEEINKKRALNNKLNREKNKVKCKMDLCDTKINSEQYDGYCIYCFINLFPDNTIVKNYKTKERTVADFIKDNFSSYDLIFDKKIFEGCSKRRPDILFDLGYQIIIIEIDENQHIRYDCSCENKRLMEISKDVGHRPIIFIRFNPDSYYDINNIKIPSCWSITEKRGLLKISNKIMWNNRLNSLKEQIKYWIENKTDKTIEVIELFFNQN